jgi:large subunit ribosomal protein L32
MAVPKRRTSSTKRDTRRANHDKVGAPTIVSCSQCGEKNRPHRVCGSCGFYDGKAVIEKTTPEATPKA